MRGRIPTRTHTRVHARLPFRRAHRLLEGGRNLVAQRLTKAGRDLNQRLEAMGFEVFTPDMSMFQHGGGGVHCLSQAPRRDPVEGSA